VNVCGAKRGKYCGGASELERSAVKNCSQIKVDGIVKIRKHYCLPNSFRGLCMVIWLNLDFLPDPQGYFEKRRRVI